MREINVKAVSDAVAAACEEINHKLSPDMERVL